MTSKLKTLFIASRPISWVNTAYPFAAGHLVAGGSVNIFLIVGTVYFLIPYNLLMYGINDVFDYESDKNNPRKGGAEGGLAEPKNHKLILLSSTLLPLPFLIYLGAQSSGWQLAALVFITFTVIAYSAPVLRFKERAFLDSLTSSSHFVGPLLFALSGPLWNQDYTLYLLAFFLWGLGSHAFGAVQDVVSDQKGNVGSIAVSIGARRTVYFAAFCYIASAGLILVSSTSISSIILALTVLLYTLNVVPYRSVTNKTAERANIGWRRFLKLNYISGSIITILLIIAIR